MQFEVGPKDSVELLDAGALIITEAEAREMCDDPRCNQAILNQALLRSHLAEGWEVRGGPQTLRAAGLEDWAAKAERAITEAKEQQPEEPTPTPQAAGDLQAVPQVYSDHVAALRAAQAQRGAISEPSTLSEPMPRGVLIEALQPVAQFGQTLREAGVVKWAGPRSDIGWPNCAFESFGRGVDYVGYPVVHVYCVRARDRGPKRHPSWEIRVWSDALNKRSRRFTDRDGYDKLFRFLTECLAKM